MIPRLAKNTHGSQTFWGVDETNTGGLLGVIINGDKKFNGDMLSSTRDYCGVVTADGFSPGKNTYQMMLNGNAVGGIYNFNAIKNKGSDLEYMFIGEYLSANVVFQTVLERENDIAGCWSDESAYTDGGDYGVDWPDLVANNRPDSESKGYSDPDTKAYRDGMYTNQRGEIESTLNLSRRLIYSKYPFRFLPNSDSNPGENLYNGSRSAIYAYYTKGNPQPAENSLYYSEILGNTEIVHSSLIGSTETRGKSDQKEWLINIINNTSAKFLIIYLDAAIPNNANWTNASTGIFRAIGDSATPTIIITADKRTAYAKQHTMFGANIMEIGISPEQQRSIVSTEITRGQKLYFEDSNVSSFNDVYTKNLGPYKTYLAYGKVIERPNGSPKTKAPHMECEIINALTGYKRFSFTVDENKNISIQRNLSVI